MIQSNSKNVHLFQYIEEVGSGLFQLFNVFNLQRYVITKVPRPIEINTRQRNAPSNREITPSNRDIVPFGQAPLHVYECCGTTI
jgi:hypothetical protein